MKALEKNITAWELQQAEKAKQVLKEVRERMHLLIYFAYFLGKATLKLLCAVVVCPRPLRRQIEPGRFEEVETRLNFGKNFIDWQ